MINLRNILVCELDEGVDPRVMAMAEAVANQHGASARAVLFYGSCLREKQLDGLMLDFYLIVSDYRQAYEKRWLAVANRLIPPNVFPFAFDGLAAKYAVLSEEDFASLNSTSATTVSVWARFSQPTRLVWTRGETAREKVIQAVCAAPRTLLSLAKPIAKDSSYLGAWQAGFAETYRAELRAERRSRSGSIVDADPARYEQIAKAVWDDLDVNSPEFATRRWRQLQRHGKLMSVVRLAKASFTFSGGIDYLAWKINRHAATAIEIKPWQRRWPLVAALFLVPKLLRSGAVR